MKTIKIKNSFAQMMNAGWSEKASLLAGIFTGKSLPRLIRKGCVLAVLLLTLMLLTNAPTQAQGFLEWAKQAGGSSVDGANCPAIDASGNIYITGDFGGTATFGGTILTSPNADDIFVTKYSSAGDLIWAKRAGGLGDNAGRAIAVDASGNSYVTGDIRGNATFGFGEINETTLLNANDHNIFVAKYDPNGNLQWAKQAGGLGDDRGFGIGIDAFGNSYVTGDFEGIATFEGTNLTSAGAHDMFLAKYDPNGGLVWVRQAGGVDLDMGRAIAVDTSGNSYLTSTFSDSATFGTTNLTSAGSVDIFVAKYDTNGDLVWVKQAGGSSNDVGWGIAIDASGNSYVTGFFNGTAAFGATNLTSTGFLDIFVAKYDFNGDLVWVKQAGGSSGDIGGGTGIALDAYNNSYVTGYFTGSTTFGTGEANVSILESAGAGDIFVAKYNSNGVLEWGRQAGGLSDDVSLGIAVDSSGNSYLAGFFESTATFGPGVDLTSAGASDVFVAKFGQCAQQIIAFAGRDWVVRQASNQGPGPNNWSACPESVWVDSDGLHLKIRYDAAVGKWYSAQVSTKDYSQHGIHRFNITTPAGKPLDGLDKNVVFGLFLSRDYEDYVAESNDPFEIDIEFAKWGTTRTANVDYTVWHTFNPVWNPDLRWTVPRTMEVLGESNTSHFIDWSPSEIQFSSFKGHEPIPGVSNLLCNWNTIDSSILADDIPKEDKDLRININLWLINSDTLTVGDPPSDGQEVEIIVKDFIFTDPDTDNDGIFDEIDVEPTVFSETFSDNLIGGTTAGTITNRGDQILTIKDSPHLYPDINNGVLIKADPSGGTTVARFVTDPGSDCNTSPPTTYTLDAGDEVIVTCGSVIFKVISGQVDITFVAADGTPSTTTLNTGNTLTFDPTTFTFTAPSSNATSAVILINGTEFSMNPGETITIAQFEEFNPSVEIWEEEFQTEGSFTLKATSNGIDPLNEDVILEVGTFTTTIPAGSFVLDNGEYVFEGVIAAVALEMSISALGGNEFNFTMIGEGADFTGTFNPVTVYLRIRDDAGTASIMADWYCQNNKVIICHNGNTLCINGNALPAHLNHGDYTGPCIPSGGQNLIIPGGRKTTTSPFEVAELKVFPNPAGIEVNIRLLGAETTTELTIYDQLGKVVWTGLMEEGQFSTSISLDNNRFDNGIYFVSAITKIEKISRRLVIVR